MTIKPVPSPTHISGYEWRHLRREDAVALNRMLLAVEAADHNGFVDTLEEREGDFNDPFSHFETDSIIAVAPAGEIAAVAWAHTRPPEQEQISYLLYAVHPQHRGIGLEDAGLQWVTAQAEQRLRAQKGDRSAWIQIGYSDHLPEEAALFARHGFQPVRHIARMRSDLRGPLPEAPIPPAIEIVDWRDELKEQTRLANNDAFLDHWGFVPIEPEGWELWYAGHYDFRADFSLQALADDPENPVAGYLLGFYRTAENEQSGLKEGWVQDVGVRRPYRKQGLATALLVRALEKFRAAGLEWAGLTVDAENTTGALRLYERLGFRKIHARTVVRRPVV